MNLIKLFKAFVFTVILALALVEIPSQVQAAVYSATIPGSSITNNMQYGNGMYYAGATYYTSGDDYIFIRPTVTFTGNCTLPTNVKVVSATLNLYGSIYVSYWEIYPQPATFLGHTFYKDDWGTIPMATIFKSFDVISSFNNFTGGTQQFSISSTLNTYLYNCAQLAINKDSSYITINYVYVPSTPTISTPTPVSYNPMIVTLTASSSVTGGAVIIYNWQYSTNGSTWIDAGSTTSTAYNWEVPTSIETGSSVYVRCKATADGADSAYSSSSVFTKVASTVPTVSLSTPVNGVTFTETAGNNTIIIAGTTQDSDVGNTLTVKYTIDGLPNYTDVTLATLTANGNQQAFSGSLTIDNNIPEGTYTLCVWTTDNLGLSSETIRTFIVDKSAIGGDGQPILRVITSEEKAFNVSSDSGNFTDVTSSFLQNNTGSSKPFYIWNDIYSFSNTDNAIYDNGSTMTYIGNDTFRVVTSEGKAFDVNKDTGTYTEVTASFLVNNFGSGKPFYNKVSKLKINGAGPYFFYDFGSTMAYIGNNIIRVVTSEGKAFDVDKDTGAYTETSSTFLENNFGSGKPFYLREYTHTIGGEAKTFYDWGSSMAYIGNDTLRVVTSEGKAFDVNVNDGSYTEITSTFLINNFGEGKPFYHREYPVTINGTNYTFHDWGCTMAYTIQENPALTIDTSLKIVAFDTITLSGSVSDIGNNNVTISASIAGVSKSTVVSNTSTSQEWTLIWDVSTDIIPDGSYSNIVVSADNGVGDITNATYRGNIHVYGASSNITRNKVYYQYDSNGKLVCRYIINNP